MESLQDHDTARREILAGLQSAESEQLRNAAFAAGDMRLVEAVPLLVSLIQNHNLGIQEAAEFALRKIRGSVTVYALLPSLYSDDAPQRNIAMDILREIGTDDIPAFSELRQSENSDLRIFITDILGSTGALLAVPQLCDSLLRDPEVNVRYQAAVSLGTLGFPEAADSLQQALHDEEWVQFAVVEALTKVRAQSTVQILAQALTTSSSLVASTIVDALAEMGNVTAVPLLFKNLESAALPLRRKIAKAIVRILGVRSLSLLSAKEQARLREYLLDALEDEDEDTQMAALEGLSVMPSPAVTQAVFTMLEHVDTESQTEIVLAAIHCIANSGVNEAYITALHSKQENILHCAIHAVLFMQDRSCIDLLKEIFWINGRDVQREIAEELVEIGIADDIPFMVDLLNRHKDAHVLRSALMFLGNKMHARQYADKMMEFLQHPFNDIKDIALEACIALNDPYVHAQFKDLFHSEDPTQRMMAVYALGRLDLEQNLQELSSALLDKEPLIRKVAIEALGSQLPIPDERLQLLEQSLSDEDRDVRLSLVGMLGETHDERIVPFLLRALEDDDDWVKIRAIESLGHSHYDESVPLLVDLMGKSSILVAMKIIEALGTIGGRVAFSALLGCLGHADPQVQEAVTMAVERIQAESEGTL